MRNSYTSQGNEVTGEAIMKWFSLKGIKTEVQRIRWPHPKDLMHDTSTVVWFSLGFALFFVACESLSALFLKWIGA